MANVNIKPLEDKVLVQIAEAETVIFSKYGGTELKYGGEEFLLLSARDLLAVVEK